MPVIVRKARWNCATPANPQARATTSNGHEGFDRSICRAKATRWPRINPVTDSSAITRYRVRREIPHPAAIASTSRPGSRACRLTNRCTRSRVSAAFVGAVPAAQPTAHSSNPRPCGSSCAAVARSSRSRPAKKSVTNRTGSDGPSATAVAPVSDRRGISDRGTRMTNWLNGSTKSKEYGRLLSTNVKVPGDSTATRSSCASLPWPVSWMLASTLSSWPRAIWLRVRRTRCARDDTAEMPTLSTVVCASLPWKASGVTGCAETCTNASQITSAQ